MTASGPEPQTVRALPRPVAVAVIAKAPAPGRSKTRLCPPLTAGAAAQVAEAALVDTLEAIAGANVRRRVVVLDGRPGAWLRPGFDVVPQRGEGLDERLAAAFEDLGGPAVIVGGDTPQVTPALLDDAVRALEAKDTDAVLGSAYDGGYWAIGLRRPDVRAFLGVPMSRADTGRVQRVRLGSLGLRTRLLPPLRDVDRIDDAVHVAESIPGSTFARTLHGLLGRPVERADAGARSDAGRRVHRSVSASTA